MSNYRMKVDFFGTDVRCETENRQLCLNDLIIAGNVWRNNNGLPAKKLQDVTQTKAFNTFVETVVGMKGGNKEDYYTIVGRGRTSRTMGDVTVAIYVAEQMSPEFHVKVIDTFIEGKLLEFRELGGTEFVQLNSAIDSYLPGRELKKSNKGIYINVAKLLRCKILGVDTDWNSATVEQTHRRYKYENQLVGMLRLGVIRDYDHLKEIIERI